MKVCARHFVCCGFFSTLCRAVGLRPRLGWRSAKLDRTQVDYDDDQLALAVDDGWWRGDIDVVVLPAALYWGWFFFPLPSRRMARSLRWPELDDTFRFDGDFRVVIIVKQSIPTVILFIFSEIHVYYTCKL